jgi:carboxypeptidase Q
MLAPWLAPLASLGIELPGRDAGGDDLSPLGPYGVRLFAVHPGVTHYFDIHHSAADTFDKIDPPPRS